MTGPSVVQHRRMHALWRKAGVTARHDRLALTAAAIGHQVTSSSDLTEFEATLLTRYMARLDDAGVLRSQVEAWLARQECGS